MKRYRLSPPKLSSLLAGLVLTYAAVFLALGLLAAELHQARSADCHRTAAIVKGIYGIVDRGADRQHTLYLHHVITYKQYQVAVVETGRIHRAITLPHC